MFSLIKTQSYVWWQLLFFREDVDGSGPLCKEDPTKEVMEKGTRLLSYRDSTNAAFAVEHAYTTLFEGYKTICANSSTNPNHVFVGMDLTPYEVFAAYVFDGKKWTVSLRTHQDNNIDVSEIAKKYGGGGHKKAAGFGCDTLPEQFTNSLLINKI